MGTFKSFRKAYGALKDSTLVGLAKVNSEYKDLDIAIVKSTSHVEHPPKERHVRKIFYATSAHQPRADVAYCIHALARRLSKTKSWIVAVKTLIVIHRTLREGDPTFREELESFCRRGNIFQISNFKDDSSPQAWDYSAWVRAYALYLEERVECSRVLRYDVESERLSKSPSGNKTHSRTRMLACDELLEQLPSLQQLIHRLIGCQPEGSSCYNYLIQYALVLVLKESFKIYCAINDGIINLVDVFFDMSRHDAFKALNIYKRAGLQAKHLDDLYQYCKGLELSRNFQFPALRQPPPSFLATMEDYLKEAPQLAGSSAKELEWRETDESPRNEEPEESEEHAVEENETKTEEVVEEKEVKQEEVEPPPLISTDGTADLLGLNEINPKALELEESNALALAIVPPGGNDPSTNAGLSNIAGTTGWELALVTTPSNNISQPLPNRKMAGGFDKLLLDSLYEDENARRHIQLQNAGYGHTGMFMQSPFHHQNQNQYEYDPFAMSNNIAPPTNVQLALLEQQQSMFQQQHNMMMVPYYSNNNNYSNYNNNNNQYSQAQYPQQIQLMGSSNPFGDPLPVPNHPYNSVPQRGNYNLL